MLILPDSIKNAINSTISPFFSLPALLKTDDKILKEKMNLMIQFFLATANAYYCEHVNQNVIINFGEFIDKNAAQFCKLIYDTLNNDVPFENAIIQYLNKFLTVKFTDAHIDGVCKYFNMQYNSVKDAKHFDEFFIFLSSLKGKIYRHQGRFAVDLSDYYDQIPGVEDTSFLTKVIPELTAEGKYTAILPNTNNVETSVKILVDVDKLPKAELIAYLLENSDLDSNSMKNIMLRKDFLDIAAKVFIHYAPELIAQWNAPNLLLLTDNMEDALFSMYRLTHPTADIKNQSREFCIKTLLKENGVTINSYEHNNGNLLIGFDIGFDIFSDKNINSKQQRVLSIIKNSEKYCPYFHGFYGASAR